VPGPALNISAYRFVDSDFPAALVLRAQGLEAYQLEGSILKCFEETAGAPHWRGDCFVFDQRVGLGPGLAPASPRA